MKPDSKSARVGRSPAAKGPGLHRFMVGFFNCLLALLTYWLLSFVLRDIGDLDGPDYALVEERHVDAAQKSRYETLESEAQNITQLIRDNQEQQRLVSDSVSNLQKTLEQLVKLRQLSIEKGVPVPESELTELTSSRELFLEHQGQYQTLSSRAAELKAQEIETRTAMEVLNAQLNLQRAAAQAEFQSLRKKHLWKVAALKIGVLAPIVALLIWLSIARRQSVYRSLIYASAVAVFLKLGMVMHEYFPARYFKYILVLIGLAIVLWLLVYLISAARSPKADWLLKQYREAYEKFLCPVCGFPIRRGPLKYLFWTSRTLKNLKAPEAGDPAEDAPYTCPSCGTALFEPCGGCGKTRASLLPACEHCGADGQAAAMG